MQIEDRGYGARDWFRPRGKYIDSTRANACSSSCPDNRFPADQARHLLMTDRSAPGNLIDARSAYYLISQQLPSPMGAGLSAFRSQDSLRAFHSRYDGEMLDWKELYLRFTKR